MYFYGVARANLPESEIFTCDSRICVVKVVGADGHPRTK